MISRNNDLFGDTGHTKEELLDEWMMIGKVEKQTPQYEPMIKGEMYYISNTLPIGTKIFESEKDAGTISVKINYTYIKYELIEDHQYITIQFYLLSTQLLPLENQAINPGVLVAEPPTIILPI